MRRRHKAVSPARLVAHSVLVRVARDEAFADRALGIAMERAHLQPEDRRLATQLVMGTLRNQGWLDFLLGSLLSQPLRKMPSAPHQALRLGLYEILELRTADYAAVNDSVELAGSTHPHLKRVGNGLLRRAITLRDEGTLPAPQGDPLAVLAIRSSHPEWLVREIAARRGLAATTAWVEANNREPPVTLRARRGRTTPAALLELLQAEGIDATLAPLPASDPAIWLRSAGAVHDLPGFDQGLFAVQDAAAQLVGYMADVTPEMTILDVCAAPGGKATHLAELMWRESGSASAEEGPPPGRVVAVDVHPGKINLVSKNAQRLGLTNLSAVAGDARDPAVLRQALAQSARRTGDSTTPNPTGGRDDADTFADLVVLDAPCSGLGTLRRNPELRGRKESELTSLVTLQDELLDACAQVVRPGGVLVYVVCTVTSVEGEARVAACVARHPELSVETPTNTNLAPYLEGPFLRTFTDRDGTDGFFAARLRRRAAS